MKPASPLGPSTQRPNCWQCQHLGVSHVPRSPYLCRLLDFRSAVLPSIEVLRADGQPCRGFRPKPARPAAPARTVAAR